MTPRERHFYRRGKKRAAEEALMVTGVIALGILAMRILVLGMKILVFGMKILVSE